MSIIQIAGQTHTGMQRKDNQDTYLCERLDSPKWAAEGLALLAAIDGVGGYMGGDIAAGIARDYILQYMSEPKGDILSMLREAVVNANNEINAARRQDLKLSQMCCVLTTAVADAARQKLYFVHVGDTRLYRFREGALTKLTKDHSIVGIREDAQEITEEEAMNHSRRNEILRDVGSRQHQIDDEDFYDADEAEFLAGDLLLLCSDGLTDMLTQAQITAVLTKNKPLEAAVAELIELANQQGGKDNITVILAQNESPIVFKNPKRKTQDLPVLAPEQPSEASLEEKAPQKSSGLSRKVKGMTYFLKWGVGLLVLLAAVLLGLYFWRTKEKAPESTFTAETSEPQVSSLTSPPSDIDKLIRQALADSSRQLVLEDGTASDTLRLTSTIAVSDSISIIKKGKPLIVTPADSSSRFLAFKVAEGGRVSLDNVIFQNFETVFQVQDKARISLRRVQFRAVGTKVKADWTQDDSTKTQQLIFTSTSLAY